MSASKQDIDTALQKQLAQASADFVSATLAREDAERRIKQLNFALSLITQRDKLTDGTQ